MHMRMQERGRAGRYFLGELWRHGKNCHSNASWPGRVLQSCRCISFGCAACMHDLAAVKSYSKDPQRSNQTRMTFVSEELRAQLPDLILKTRMRCVIPFKSARQLWELEQDL